jgi:hypothetical protein
MLTKLIKDDIHNRNRTTYTAISLTKVKVLVIFEVKFTLYQKI